jgi:hypothetical protein
MVSAILVTTLEAPELTDAYLRLVWSTVPSFSLPLFQKTARMLPDHLFICSRSREDLAQVATARGAREGSTLSLSSINVESQCSVDSMYKVASSDVCLKSSSK